MEYVVIYWDYGIITQKISFLGREFFDDLKFFKEYEDSETVIEEVSVMWAWIVSNKEWVFSGVGVTLAVAFIGLIRGFLIRKNTKHSKIIYRQENKNHSYGVQIGVQNNYGGKDNE
ncbi:MULTISPECIES: hypothetical protein [Anaerotignum]|uniref:hypothetical protein n=1 Tax=Anaerotignum TaxID=2039240 RepID=UPI0021099F1C|nr:MULTISPECIES: hypothetical protein [Anaerotignum]MCQ4936721.1 hypothetical protein [Anaerotignum propionicum]